MVDPNGSYTCIEEEEKKNTEKLRVKRQTRVRRSREP